MTTEDTQIESIRTVSQSPRFDLQVNGVTVRVTRLRTDDRGRTHFELADATEPGLRTVFPRDRGYVKGGDVYVRSQGGWEPVGPAQSSRLRVGDSVGAELASEDSG